MMPGRSARRLGAIAGGAALIAMGGLTAGCGTSNNPSPSSTTTTTTTTTTTSVAPPVTPTEKSINPTGGNLFTPPVKAPPPATAIPGNH
jgi:hypothetical protein